MFRQGFPVLYDLVTVQQYALSGVWDGYSRQPLVPCGGPGRRMLREDPQVRTCQPQVQEESPDHEELVVPAWGECRRSLTQTGKREICMARIWSAGLYPWLLVCRNQEPCLVRSGLLPFCSV